jgi:type IV secretory pathway TrbD component
MASPVDLLLLLAALGFGFGGFAALALSQERNWRAIAGGSEPRVALLRGLGALLVAAGFGAALWREDDAGFGLVLGVVLLSVQALAVVATLAWRPAALRRFASPLAAPQPSDPRHALET